MKTLLTGKTLEQFKEWIVKKHGWDWYQFSELPFSMQYGVIEDFFEYLDIYILINTDSPKGKDNWIVTILRPDIMMPYFELCEPFYADSREEARIKAIEKANELNNKQNQ